VGLRDESREPQGRRGPLEKVTKVLERKETDGGSVGKHVLHDDNDKGFLLRFRLEVIDSVGCVFLVLREDERPVPLARETLDFEEDLGAELALLHWSSGLSWCLSCGGCEEHSDQVLRVLQLKVVSGVVPDLVG